MRPSADWIEDCMHWHGRVLTGKLAHWCSDWDDLPVDETTHEIDCCTCFTSVERDEDEEGEKVMSAETDAAAISITCRSMARLFVRSPGLVGAKAIIGLYEQVAAIADVVEQIASRTGTPAEKGKKE